MQYKHGKVLADHTHLHTAVAHSFFVNLLAVDGVTLDFRSSKTFPLHVFSHIFTGPFYPVKIGFRMHFLNVWSEITKKWSELWMANMTLNCGAPHRETNNGSHYALTQTGAEQFQIMHRHSSIRSFWPADHIHLQTAVAHSIFDLSSRGLWRYIRLLEL